MEEIHKKEIAEMAAKHIQDIQTFLVQVKTIVRFHFSSMKLAKVKNIYYSLIGNGICGLPLQILDIFKGLYNSIPRS